MAHGREATGLGGLGKMGWSAGVDEVIKLARDLVRIDSRSFVSNLAVSDRIEAELGGFEIERIDFTDAEGVAKRALVARRGEGGLAFSGHMDTVPDTGWTDDPWSGRIADGILYGLGSADMKGPIAAFIVAARSLPANVPVCLLITTDEETTKLGARMIVERSLLARARPLAGIVVAEPTRLEPVRGHRAHVAFTATSEGVQAHSATGLGRNANWALVGFLAEMKALHERLRTDPAMQDSAYDPVFSDFNIVIDNHGAAINVTVPKATVRIKYRYSARMDAGLVVSLVRDAAARAGLTLEEAREGTPPELACDHPLIAQAVALSGKPARTVPFGTDASVLQEIAPCVVIGPGDIADAHKPTEKVVLADLADGVELFRRMALAAAG
jgi:acetylornithine deacetylase/succinyl-diaminopimelate desuccinylase-like protein